MLHMINVSYQQCYISSMLTHESMYMLLALLYIINVNTRKNAHVVSVVIYHQC